MKGSGGGTVGCGTTDWCGRPCGLNDNKDSRGHSNYILARVVGPTGNQFTSWCHVTDADCVPVATAGAGGAVGGCFQAQGEFRLDVAFCRGVRMGH